jgi:YD repeat-containing protein
MKGIRIAALIAALTTAACAASRSAPLGSTAEPAGERASERPVAELHKGYVDLATGLYVREDDDLIVHTPFPVVLRRTYLSGDRVSRHFGIGTTHAGEWYMYGDGNPRIPWADLILANSTRIHFTRISSGDTQANAVLTYKDPGTEFDGALLKWDGEHWAMGLRDGSGALFLDCPPSPDCSVIERWDARGNRIAYRRDSSGTLLEMTSADQGVAFEYDERRRIVTARDTSGRRVSYDYDGKSRLVRSTTFAGVVRTYTYDENDLLISVIEAGKSVENAFDDAGRVIGQVVRWTGDPEPYFMTFDYVVDGKSVIETTVTDDEGTRTVYRYDKDQRLLSTTRKTGGPRPTPRGYFASR